MTSFQAPSRVLGGVRNIRNSYRSDNQDGQTVKLSFDDLTYESRLETGRKAEQGRERKTGYEKEVKKKRKESD